MQRMRTDPKIEKELGARASVQASLFQDSDAQPFSMSRAGALRAIKRLQPCSRAGAFTLIEMLVVIAIVATLLILLAPAFTNIKSGSDVTNAAYTIKGLLETARTYAKANNTYTWVGFYEEDVSRQSVIPAPDPRCTGCVGRVVMSIVASKDGTNLGADASSSATGTENFIDATQLIQVNKLVRIDNLHLPLFAMCTSGCNGATFDSRPVLQSDPFGIGYNASRFGELNASAPNTAPYDVTNTGLTKFPFQYPVASPAPAPQYQFRRTLRFSPSGDCRINSTYDVRNVIEVGLLQTHGAAVPAPVGGSGSNLIYSGNVAAVQLTGFGSSVKIYQR
jgi:prepilin-type N-terminal cleavage/methylation domain-containing protein